MTPELERVWGERRPHAHCSARNLTNCLLVVVALVPSVLVSAAVFWWCSARSDARSASECAFVAAEPFAILNVLFFTNVCVGFWLIGLAQKSFWLIDPFWTLLPPLLCCWYLLHALWIRPGGVGNLARIVVWLGLVALWSARLTWSYFRRERWRFGEREDWRYTDMARRCPRVWWIVAFFAVGIAQQPLLVGVTWPYAVLVTASTSFGAIDCVAALGALLGLAIAYAADNELAAYMARNAERRARGVAIEPLLRTGLWAYSRHPNYVGEQVWWWCVALCGATLSGRWILLAGAALNTLCLASVTVMTEKRMLDRWDAERAALFAEHQRATSVWLLLPRGAFRGCGTSRCIRRSVHSGADGGGGGAGVSSRVRGGGMASAVSA
jgi:steroid 5-alpha reductase family enzyme